MVQRPDPAKQGRWPTLIRRWQRSQGTVTVREFCEHHHVSDASFFSWRHVLCERGLLDEPTTAKPRPNAPAFVEFAVADAEPTVNNWNELASAQSYVGRRVGTPEAQVDFKWV